MVTPELLDYIRQHLAQGRTQAEIRTSLLEQKWSTDDINEAYLQVTTTPPSSSQPPAYPPTLLSVSDLLHNTWMLYTKRWKTLVGIMAAGVIFAIIPALLLWGLSAPLSNVIAAVAVRMYPVVGFGVLGITLLFIIFISLWYSIATVWATISVTVAINEEKLDVQTAYSKGWRILFSYWWLSVLSTLIVVGGIWFFVIPGIIFFVSFSQALTILIVEHIRGMNAMLKSREYVRGRWWAVAKRLLVLMIIAIGVPLLLVILVAVVQFALQPELIRSSMGLRNIEDMLDSTTQIILGVGIHVFFTPFVIVYSYLLYMNLRAVKGPFSFIPTKKSKIIILLVAFAGHALILTGPVVLFILLSRVRPDSSLTKYQNRNTIFPSPTSITAFQLAVTPKSENTWETFTNPTTLHSKVYNEYTLQYSFEYPTDRLSVKEKGEFYTVLFPIKESEPESLTIQIRYANGWGGFSIDDFRYMTVATFLNEYTNQPFFSSGQWKIQKITPVTIIGIPAFMISVAKNSQDGTTSYAQQTFIKKQEHLFEISMDAGSQETLQKYSDIYERIRASLVVSFPDFEFSLLPSLMPSPSGLPIYCGNISYTCPNGTIKTAYVQNSSIHPTKTGRAWTHTGLYGMPGSAAFEDGQCAVPLNPYKDYCS